MSAVTFDRDAIRAFRFVRCGFDAATGVAQLVYAFDDGPELIETVTLPGAPFVLDDARAEAATRALRLLHLIAGVSYYKAAVPPEIRIDAYDIDAAAATLLADVYLHGLGEIAYRNGLDLRDRIRFPASESAGGGEPPLPPAGEGRGEGKIAAAGSPSSGPAGHLPPEKGTEVPHAGEGKGVGLREHALVAIG